MFWQHQCSREWLQARKKYLTASEVRSLLPFTASGKARKSDQIASSCLDVWAHKQETVSEEDVYSKGAMARGHILEPWAIREYNNHLSPEKRLFHWDDTLVYSEGTAYSPDALDILPPQDCHELPDNGGKRILGEVKCYQANRHYAVAHADKMCLEERWQIAMAMYVSPSLEEGHLILFNPNVRHPLFYHVYTRAELFNELEAISETVVDYEEASLGFTAYFDALSLPSSVTEEDIIQILEEQQAPLNP